MMPLPIRWKFAVCAAALVGGVLLIFAGGTFVHLYLEQREEVDLTIEAEVQHVMALEETGMAARGLDEMVRFQPWLRIAIFDRDGNLLRRSDRLPESVARAALARTGIHSGREKAGETWRLCAVRRDGTVVVIAHTLAEVNDIMRDLLYAYVVLVPLMLAVAAIGGWWAASRALAPLRDLATAARNIRADHLDRRVPVHPAEDEIRRLAEVLNAMLGRLEQSFLQTQRFAADASHELRTPLTIMQGELERLLRSTPLERTHEEKLLSLQEEICRLDRITEHLLLLARFDAGQVNMLREEIDLSELVRVACEDAEMLADARAVGLTTAISPGVRVSGDPAHLRRLVLALLDNATRYNETGGSVECTLERGDDGVHLRVRNTGPGIPSRAREHLFQRFFRVDPARGRGGHGLGLSLCREIARAHDAKIELNAAAADGWTEFVVTLPAVNPARVPAAV